ncbi:MAG TPA: ATP-binding cassette domain-containing protein [Candidatus Limnocylindria bacterium]|nr:ATP-binding cassette domain-containing protein [Candidatus Limnocylindria bacterium]
MSILIEQVTKRFGAQLVLDRVSLGVAPGELFVLLGASGSGKSTMLRVVAGLTMPDRGRISLADRDVTTLAPQERGTGFVFQNYSVFRHMTVGQNIEFGLKLRNVSGSERARRRDELLDLVGLPGLASREAVRLSGGQQQRVAIARALAYEPKVLLLDEPFGALDVKIRTQLRRSLRAIHDRLRITTLLVTHDQEEAFELADRVGLMDRGRLIEIGRAEELYARPRSLFAATFLGSGTVLTGHHERGEARFQGLEFKLPHGEGREEGANAHLLIRPEDLLVSAAPPPAGQPALGTGAVIDQSFAGAMRRVRIRLPIHAEVHQASSPPSGPEGLTVDALLPSGDVLPAHDVWVTLRRWHFLEPPAASLLVADLGRGPTAPLEVARDLARGLDAQVTVLGVAADARESDQLGHRIARRQRRSGLSAGELRMRFGAPAIQILNEQAELLSQMIVLGPRAGRFAWFRGPRAVPPRRIGKTIVTLLEQSRVPVLVVIGPWHELLHLAVVTIGDAGAAGLLRAAARLARPLGMAVTLIEVEAAASSVLDGTRAPRPAAQDPLESAGVGIRSRQRIAARNLDEMCSGVLEVTADLIAVPVIRHGPQEINEVAPLVTEILSVADRPVLIVPTQR